jgi:hypothetical protein
MNPLHKPDEDKLLRLFRRVWAGAGQIASAEIKDAPDVRGVLVGGRRFGMEIVTLTENSRAQSDGVLHGSFTRELEVACAAEGINASFGLNLGDWQAERLVDRANRERVVALLVRLAKEADGQPLDLDEDAVEARGIDDLDGVAIEPIPDGIEVYIARSGRGLGSEFVRERIARKDKRAPEYRAAIGDADLWLLLVVGTTLSASVMRPSLAEAFKTLFDRVFFMECWVDIEKVVELAVQRIE